MAQNHYNQSTYANTNAATYGDSQPPSFNDKTTSYNPQRDPRYWTNNPNNPEYWTQTPQYRSSSHNGRYQDERPYNSSSYIPPDQDYHEDRNYNDRKYDDRNYDDRKYDDRNYDDRYDDNYEDYEDDERQTRKSDKDGSKKRASSADAPKASSKEPKGRFDNLDIALIFGTVALSFGATFAGRKMVKSRHEKKGGGGSRSSGGGGGGRR